MQDNAIADDCVIQTSAERSEKAQDIFVNGKCLLKEEESEESLSTGVASLDALFQGGLPLGMLLEVVGPSSAGKSQLCMQLAIVSQMRRTRKKCVYIDTEGCFSTPRLCNMASARLNDDSLCFLEQIHHSRCRDLVELTSAISRLDDLLQHNPEIVLVIVDSVAMPFRGETDYTRCSVTSIARSLSRLAVLHRCVVIVVNHVTFRFRGDENDSFAYLSSALGSSWSHRPTARLWLGTADTKALKRTAYLTKSPYSPEASFPYSISNAGIVEVCQEGEAGL